MQGQPTGKDMDGDNTFSSHQSPVHSFPLAQGGGDSIIISESCGLVNFEDSGLQKQPFRV